MFFLYLNLNKFGVNVIVSFSKRNSSVFFILILVIFFKADSMFFAAYVIRRKKISINTVVFLFFFQSQIANFFFKINDSSGVRTTKFWNGGTGFESLPCQTILRLHWHLLYFPFHRFPKHNVAQHGYELVGPGLSLCRANISVISLFFVRKPIGSYGTVCQRPGF